MSYDVMKDAVVRQGIRDSMIEDMRRSLAVIADWPAEAEQMDYPCSVEGIREYARGAIRRQREAWSKL